MGNVEDVFSAESEAEVCRRRLANQRARELAEMAEGVGEPALATAERVEEPAPTVARS